MDRVSLSMLSFSLVRIKWLKKLIGKKNKRKYFVVRVFVSCLLYSFIMDSFCCFYLTPFSLDSGYYCFPTAIHSFLKLRRIFRFLPSTSPHLTSSHLTFPHPRMDKFESCSRYNVLLIRFRHFTPNPPNYDFTI